MELNINHISKQYGDKVAVNDLNLKLNPGIYGLLGANGAGKTTLMRLMCDIQTPTEGQILYNGEDIRCMGETYREALGYLPQHFGYYPEFTAYKFLLYIASLKGINKRVAKEKSEALLELVGLKEVKHKKIKAFSGGMKQRLGIAQAMLNDPEVLILDEPTAGLDPKERVKFRNLISSFSKDKIVILSTHIVSDIEYIADEILIMKEGKMIHRGDLEEVTRQVEGCVWECEVETNKSEQLVEQYNVGNLRNVGEKTVLRIVSSDKPMENAVQVAPNLEDVYLYYFNEEAN